MEYNKLRNKVNKFYTGGNITRYQLGGNAPTLPGAFDGLSDGNGYVWDATLKMWKKDPNTLKFNNPSIIDQQLIDSAKLFGVSFSTGNENDLLGKTTTTFGNNGAIVSENSNTGTSLVQSESNNEESKEDIGGNSNIQGLQGLDKAAKGLSNVVGNLGGDTGKIGSLAVNAGIDAAKKAALTGDESAAAAAGIGIIGGMTTQAMGMTELLTMGDKKFSEGSQALDSVVHGASGALMSSGNPYAMAAGVVLEGANFLTKAGGQTVQGYDVNIENSGYGNLGHMESSSSRDFGALIGLGGVFNKGAMERKLAKRNEQARMAMKAAEISEDIKFEQEARMNSVDNVLRNNQIALSGGVDLNLLGQ